MTCWTYKAWYCKLQMFHVRIVPSVSGVFSWYAGIFEHWYRSTEGLSHALAKCTMGGNSCIFSEVSLPLRWDCDVCLCLLPHPAMWLPHDSCELHWDDSAGPLEKMGMCSLGSREWSTGPGSSVGRPCPMSPFVSTVWYILDRQIFPLGFCLHHLLRKKDVQECLLVVALYIVSRFSCNSSLLDHPQMVWSLSVMTHACCSQQRESGSGEGTQRVTFNHVLVTLAPAMPSTCPLCA